MPSARTIPTTASAGDFLSAVENTQRHEDTRAGDWTVSAVAPRKAALTLYIMAGFDRLPEIMAKLGKYKTGNRACISKSVGC